MIGQLKNRLTLQEQILTPDIGGGFTAEWHDVTLHPVIFAKIEQLSASVAFYNRQLANMATHRITIRHRSDITPQMRLIEEDKVYTITSAHDPDGKGLYLEVMAQQSSLDKV